MARAGKGLIPRSDKYFEEEDGDQLDDDTEIDEMLQNVLKQTIQAKKNAAAKKAAKVVSDFQEGFEAEVTKVEKQISKESKDIVSISEKSLGKLEGMLVSKWEEIQSLQFKYNSDANNQMLEVEEKIKKSQKVFQLPDMARILKELVKRENEGRGSSSDGDAHPDAGAATDHSAQFAALFA
eukprot:gene14047-19984_t